MTENWIIFKKLNFWTADQRLRVCKKTYVLFNFNFFKQF